VRARTHSKASPRAACPVSPDAAYHTPAAADLNGVQEVRLETPDGERLICWWAPAAANRPTLLYFQGNAG
jgi:hypothetical protein